MRRLLPAIRQLPRRQKAMIAVLLLVIILTWVAVCIVLASYLAW